MGQGHGHRRDAAGEIHRGVEDAEGAPRVAAGERDQLPQRVVIEGDPEGAQAALVIGQGAPHQGRDHLVGERLEPHHPAPRQERADHAERRVLGGGADQRDGAGLDVGQERVLLGPREAMDLVDEQERAAAVLIAARGGRGHGLANVFHPGVDRRQGDQVGADGLADQPGQGGLSSPRRPPQQDRWKIPPRRELPEQLAGAEQVVLADELGQRSRAHALGEGLADASGRGVLREQVHRCRTDDGGVCAACQ